MNITISTFMEMDQTDQAIIERILTGEKRLFETIIRRYNARLFRVGMAIMNNDADVEDVMQTVYIKAYEHLSDFRYKAGLGTWLTRILINECLRQLKKKKKNALTGASFDNEINKINGPAMQIPLNIVMNNELAKILEAALAELPEKYRLVFVLREMEQLSIAETVNTLDITEANVKIRLNRAKTMLRSRLESYYKNDAIYNFHLVRCDRIVSRVFQSLGI